MFDDSAEYEHRNVKDRRPRLEMSETVSRLYIDCVTPEDAGEYTCIAENPFNRIERPTVLTVGECLKRSVETLELRIASSYKILSVCVTYFVHNFVGILWKSTQNILHLYREMCFYTNVEI